MREEWRGGGGGVDERISTSTSIVLQNRTLKFIEKNVVKLKLMERIVYGGEVELSGFGTKKRGNPCTAYTNYLCIPIII